LKKDAAVLTGQPSGPLFIENDRSAENPHPRGKVMKTASFSNLIHNLLQIIVHPFAGSGVILLTDIFILQ
jgi:hypothetical protein